MFEPPTTNLPIVDDDVFAGLVASEYDPQQYLEELTFTNLEVAKFVNAVGSKLGEEAAKACLILYKVLDTQAECDILSGGD